MDERLEQINQLLDGELDANAEASLYAELSINEDLRTEVREQIAIKNTVSNDRMTLVPPAALTSSVFSGLGFATPLAGAAAGAAGGGFLLQWLTRFGVPVLSAIAAAGITFGVMPTSNSSDTNTPTATQTLPVTDNEPVTQPVIIGEDTTPEVRTVVRYQTSPDVMSRMNALTAENEELRNTITRLRSELDVLQRAQTTNNDPVIAANSRIAEPLSQQVQLSNTINLSRRSEPFTVGGSVAPARFSSSHTIPSFGLQIRGFALNPTVATNVDPTQEWYSNLGIGIHYRASRHSSFILEGGNEAFPMVFSGNRNGQTIQYEQNPNAFWVNAGYRHTFNPLGALSIAPFAQVSVGGSTFGPMARTSAGFQYAPNGPFSFLLGIEGAAMSYVYQDTRYVTPKFGLTYGMMVQL